MTCEVRGCASSVLDQQFHPSSEERVKFFNFPKNPIIREKWRLFCEKETIDFENTRICSLHFNADDFSTAEDPLSEIQKRCITSGAIPSIKTSPAENTTEVKVLNNTDAEEVEAGIEDPVEENKLLKEILKRERSQYKEEYTKIFSENLKLRADILEMKVAIQNARTELKRVEKNGGVYRKQNASLKREINLHYKNRCESKKRIMELEKLLKMTSDDFSSVKKLFSPSQLKVLRDPMRPYQNIWSNEDMSDAVELYTCSPAAYELLRTKGFPLPASSTVVASKDWQKKNDPDEFQNPIEDEPESKTMKFSHPDSESKHKVVESTTSDDDDDVQYVRTNENEDEIITLESEDESNHETDESIPYQNELENESSIEQEEFDMEECLQHIPETNEDEEADVDVIGDCDQEFKDEPSEDISQDS